jgi:hypothetical protein
LPFVEIIKKKTKENEIIQEETEVSTLNYISQTTLKYSKDLPGEDSRKKFDIFDLQMFNRMVSSIGMKKADSHESIKLINDS